MSEPEYLITGKQETKSLKKGDNKMVEKIKENAVTVKVVSKNIAEFVDAACLGTVSGFAIYQAHYNHELKKLWANVLMFAGLVIALQAFVLLVRSFNKVPVEHIIQVREP